MECVGTQYHECIGYGHAEYSAIGRLAWPVVRECVPLYDLDSLSFGKLLVRDVAECYVTESPAVVEGIFLDLFQRDRERDDGVDRDLHSEKIKVFPRSEFFPETETRFFECKTANDFAVFSFGSSNGISEKESFERNTPLTKDD